MRLQSRVGPEWPHLRAGLVIGVFLAASTITGAPLAGNAQESGGSESGGQGGNDGGIQGQDSAGQFGADPSGGGYGSPAQPPECPVGYTPEIGYVCANQGGDSAPNCQNIFTGQCAWIGCPDGYTWNGIACVVPAPPQSPHCVSNQGQQCSGSNSCGTLYGTIQCNGSCSVGGPTLPSNYGQACTSAPNSCGQTTSGTIGCGGTCSASAPSNSTCAVPPGCVSGFEYQVGSCPAGQTGTLEFVRYIQCPSTIGPWIEENKCVTPQTPPPPASPPAAPPPPPPPPAPLAAPDVDLKVYAPISSPTASDGPVTIGATEEIRLYWSSTYAYSCTGDTYYSTGGERAGWTPTVAEPEPGGSRRYQITCQGPERSANDSVLVYREALSSPPTLTVDPNRVRQGETTHVRGELNGNTECTIEGRNIDPNNVDGYGDENSLTTSTENYNYETGPILGETTYTIECDAGSASDTVHLLPEVEHF